MNTINGTTLQLIRADNSVENIFSTTRHPSDEIVTLSNQSDLREFLKCTPSVNRVIVLSTPMDSNGNTIGDSSIVHTFGLPDPESPDQ